MIETLRLKIFPLKYTELLKYKDSKNKLEEQFGLKKSKWKHSEEVIEMFEKRMLPRFEKDKRNYLFNSVWLIIDKKQNVIVGDFGIKGRPVMNEGKNEIEIGYGTRTEYLNKGYMTEAIGGFVKWISERKDVDIIIAETEKNNIASIKVLEKNGFVIYKETKTVGCWKK